MKRFFYRTLLVALLLNLMLIGPAYAYIDMGTGSMIFQMIVGGLVGASFTIKLYWRTIVKKMRRLLGMPVIESEAAEGESHDGQHSAKD